MQRIALRLLDWRKVGDGDQCVFVVDALADGLEWDDIDIEEELLVISYDIRWFLKSVCDILYIS